ncbi:CII family transcriptional regulator [Candidatus Arsenophonus triatominarum]|uniref:CII family transcriptional regulator n=1 Tax=Candidatus Arsenophonus triatominarum TaxID=57911 RepID=UPI0013967B33
MNYRHGNHNYTQIKCKNIEAKIRNGIQVHSAIRIAEAIGVNPSQITRWQSEDGVIPKMAKLLDCIGYDSPKQDLVITNISGKEIRKLIDMLEYLRLPKKEASRLKNDKAFENCNELCV